MSQIEPSQVKAQLAKWACQKTTARRPCELTDRICRHLWVKLKNKYKTVSIQNKKLIIYLIDLLAVHWKHQNSQSDVIPLAVPICPTGCEWAQVVRSRRKNEWRNEEKEKKMSNDKEENRNGKSRKAKREQLNGCKKCKIKKKATLASSKDTETATNSETRSPSRT